MKKSTILTVCTALLLPAIMFPIGASASPAPDLGSTADFKDVAGKEWILTEVRGSAKTVTMDRVKLIADNLGGVYTILFNESQINGMGAPNRYFGPYTQSGGNALSIGNVASTMMLSFREPDGLSEREYFDYLAKVNSWNLRSGMLELTSLDSSGREAVLVYKLN